MQAGGRSRWNVQISPTSPNFAGWTEHSRYYYPLAFQFGMNGYAISQRRWNSFSPQEQQRLQQAFNRFSDQLWGYAQAIQQQAERCISGGPCRGQPHHRLILVPPNPADRQLLRQLSRTLVLPSWAARCERIHPGCRQDWDQKLAPIVGVDLDLPARP